VTSLAALHASPLLWRLRLGIGAALAAWQSQFCGARWESHLNLPALALDGLTRVFR